MIKTVTKYEFEGQEFNSLKEVKDHIHNIIGEEVLDKIIRVCPPQRHKDLFNLLDVLCQKEVRETLIKCFNVTYEEVNSFDFDDDVSILNVLDLKG